MEDYEEKQRDCDMIFEAFSRECKFCKTIFEPTTYNNNFCSDTCKLLNRRELSKKQRDKKRIQKDYTKNCVYCNNEFTTRNKRKCYCSMECSKNSRLLISVSKPLVREYFLEKFNFTCNSCDSANNGDLEIHHIIPLYKGGKDDIDNLEVLCSSCHLKKHGLKKLV